MFDHLFEESKIIQHMRNEYIEKGIEKGSVKTRLEDLLQYVEVRFLTLLEVARQITGQPHSAEQLQSLLNQLYRANTIEEPKDISMMNRRNFVAAR